MNIKELRAFLTVANTQSILAASEKLFISRQAVSKSITKLEEELGTKLFIRDQSGTSLTPSGKYLYHRARILLKDFDMLEREMKSLDKEFRPASKLCLSTGSDKMLFNKLEQLKYMSGKYPDVETITCQDSDCDFVLTNLRTDAVISFSRLNMKAAQSVPIMVSPIVFLVNNENPLAKEPVLELSWRHRVSNFILYTGGRDHCLWWPVIPRPGDACSSDLEYLFSLLKQNKGIMPMPKAMVPDDIPYAKVLRGFPEVEPCKLYLSYLSEKYYDPATFAQIKQLEEFFTAVE